MRLVLRILRKVFSSLFLAVVTFVGAPLAAGLTVLMGLIFLPLPATIPLPKTASTVAPTIIYDRNGNQIATLQQFEKNLAVAPGDIPAVLKEAVISDEDRNFYKHGGVDIRGTVRALLADLRNNKVVQGGSTITQQYVGLAYTGRQRNLLRKVREAVLAGQLDRQASKDEILYHYLSIIYLGDGNTGVGAAAEDYFHVPVSQLNASQSAALAGLIPAPTARAPRGNLAEAEAARKVVLGKMRQQDYLTPAQYEVALSQRLYLDNGLTPAPPGVTVVHPIANPPSQYPDFVDYVTRWLLGHYPESEVYGGGLRVQTTLDPKVQNDAYAAVRNTLSGTAEPLEMALASVEPQTGFVEAVVGGRQFGSGTYAQVNLALGGCDPPPRAGTPVAVSAACWSGGTITGGGSGRQPGSAWKPFVLATAFSQGVPPTKVYPAPGVYPIPGCKPTPTNICQIHNDEPGGAGGSETLAQAMVSSTNTVYAQLAPDVGCQNVATTAKAMGIESAYYSSGVQPFCQTYALGVVDVSPLDMASAYGVFPDHGQRAAPTPILQVIDGSGHTLVDNIKTAPPTTRVLSANVADNMTNVLQGVITGGTGTAAALGRPAAGKTGTTSNYTNAWFVGYTPTLSTAVWLGRADSQSTTIGKVKGVYPVYGGTLPALAWKAFMSQALAGVPATPFDQPAPITPPAPALATTTTTVAPIEPGRPAAVSGTPAGGPYTYPPPVLRQPAPPPTTPAVTLPATTTTTLPGSGVPGSGGAGGATTTTRSVP